MDLTPQTSIHFKNDNMKNIHLRLVAIALIISLLGILHFLLFGRIMTDFLSLIRMGDVISYNKTCIVLGGAPALILALILCIMALFSKDVHSSIPASIETPVSFIVVISFIIGFIANFIVPFLLLALSYHSCPQDNLHDYHVIDIKLCETLVDNRSFF